MPTFMLECGSCSHIDEFHFGSGDPRNATCRECGDHFRADGNRRYDLEGLQISGDCCSDYYDQHLGAYVQNKHHRAELMREKNVTEYVPDPLAQPHRAEALRIMHDAGPTSADKAEANLAAQNELRAASKKVRDRNFEDRWAVTKKAMDSLDP